MIHLPGGESAVAVACCPLLSVATSGARAPIFHGTQGPSRRVRLGKCSSCVLDSNWGWPIHSPNGAPIPMIGRTPLFGEWASRRRICSGSGMLSAPLSGNQRRPRADFSWHPGSLPASAFGQMLVLRFGPQLGVAHPLPEWAPIPIIGRTPSFGEWASRRRICSGSGMLSARWCGNQRRPRADFSWHPGSLPAIPQSSSTSVSALGTWVRSPSWILDSLFYSHIWCFFPWTSWDR